jgi:micrococcal nuclease
MPVRRILALALAAVAVGAGCHGSGSSCGPSSAVVTRVVDGDTVELDTGEKVRYLCINTPEISPPAECYGPDRKSVV